VAALAAGLGLVACSHDGRTLAPARPDQTLSIVTTTTTSSPGVVAPEFTLFAPWEAGTSMPVDQSCDGAGRAPSLTWAGVPSGAVELAVVMTDLDAASRIHWVVAGIDPATATSITADSLPVGAVQGMNTAGTIGYEPACPPPGQPFHRYLFELYALASPSALTPTMTAADAVATFQLYSIGTTSITGTYQR
jgi:Raf kinase inhibitor-like YbhB/YbcL family protein